MGALSYPWESYFPVAHAWATIGPTKPAPKNASYARVDARLTAIKNLKNLTFSRASPLAGRTRNI